MKQIIVCLISSMLLLQSFAQQQGKIDPVGFFTNDNPIELTVNTDMRSVYQKRNNTKIPAAITMKLDDSTLVNERITVEARGNFRKEYCALPPLKINFKTPGSPYLSPLGSLKLVNVCFTGGRDNTEYLLKEYLVYKIYNQVTDLSLRVRLLKINYVDSAANRKPVSNYAFLIEDVKDMAKRNGCVERKRPVKHTENTNRQQMTKVALFQYMIGNLDWSVPGPHNIKLIVSKEDTNSIPLAVPYDFDYCGLVNTDYALPPDQSGLKDVTQRSYQGFTRSMEELQVAANEFLEQKDKIYAMINSFAPLSAGAKKIMISFLDQFYSTIKEPKAIQMEFIRNAKSLY